MISGNTAMLFLIFSIFGHINFVLSEYLQSFEDKLVPLHTYLQKLKCMPFFTFNSKNNSTETLLDNLFELKITAMTSEF